MFASARRTPALGLALIACVLTFIPPHWAAAQAARSIASQLEYRLGLNDQQVDDAVGALLVYARERLTIYDFEDLSKRIPNADYMMEQAKLRGIVTRPLNTIDDYEASLLHTGIGQPLAHQVAPAVVDALADAGYTQERDILASVLW